jgi:hypothetical protein
MIGAQFPPDEPSSKQEQDNEKSFQCARVSGRPPSDKRQALKFYRGIAESDQAQMLPFLNYIICFKRAITDQRVTVIQRCSQSRSPQASRGHGPVWGHHETYGIGHWGFYALLATHAGQNICWFLGQWKSPKLLGHKILKCATLHVPISDIG